MHLGGTRSEYGEALAQLGERARTPRMDARPSLGRPASNAPTVSFLAEPGSPPVEWRSSDALVNYDVAVAEMERRAAEIAAGSSPEQVWVLEHPPLYTAGTSAKPSDLLDPNRLPVFQTGRGGEFTYHGPGQRVAYVMLDLTRRRQDVRAYVQALETWIIVTLARFGVVGESRPDRVGVWVRRPDKPPLPDGSVAEDKIAAIGVRVRRWTTYHGISLNVAPDLAHYAGIVPCGISGHAVTSLAELGVSVTLPEVDAALRDVFEAVFGETFEAEDRS